MTSENTEALDTLNQLERNMAIATEIKRQFGPMFGPMTGAKNFVAIENGLQFSIGSGAKNRINKVVVVLTPMDVYDVKFYSIDTTGFNDIPFKLISEHKGIYCDMLRDLFEEETGFYTSF